MKNLFVGNMSFQTTGSRHSRAVRTIRTNHAGPRGDGPGDQAERAASRSSKCPTMKKRSKAIAGLDGKEVGGRNWKVNEARPKEPRSGPPSGGGGGRGGSGGGGGGRDGAARTILKRRLSRSRAATARTTLVESSKGYSPAATFFRAVS